MLMQGNTRKPNPKLFKDSKEDKAFKRRYGLNNIFQTVGYFDHRDIQKLVAQG